MGVAGLLRSSFNLETCNNEAPLLALGVMTAPFFWHLERRTWLRRVYKPQTSDCSVLLRFVFGNDFSAPNATRGYRSADDIEDIHSSDVIRLRAREGTSAAVAEKSLAWFVYATATWPLAEFIGKCDDDSLIALPVMLRDLASVRSDEHVMYGYVHWATWRQPCEEEAMGTQTLECKNCASNVPTRRYGPGPLIESAVETGACSASQ